MLSTIVTYASPPDNMAVTAVAGVWPPFPTVMSSSMVSPASGSPLPLPSLAPAASSSEPTARSVTCGVAEERTPTVLS